MQMCIVRLKGICQVLLKEYILTNPIDWVDIIVVVMRDTRYELGSNVMRPI